MQEWAISIRNISNQKILGIKIGRENKERERESNLNKGSKGGIEKAEVEDLFSLPISVVAARRPATSFSKPVGNYIYIYIYRCEWK